MPVAVKPHFEVGFGDAKDGAKSGARKAVDGEIVPLDPPLNGADADAALFGDRLDLEQAGAADRGRLAIEVGGRSCPSQHCHQEPDILESAFTTYASDEEILIPSAFSQNNEVAFFWGGAECKPGDQ